MQPATAPPTEAIFDLRTSMMRRSVSTLNDSGNTSFFQQSTTELDASSSVKFDHDGHCVVDGDLGFWNLQQEEEKEGPLLGDLVYDWREASVTGATLKLFKQAEADAISIIIGAGDVIKCQRLPISASNQPSNLLLLGTRSSYGPPLKPLRTQSQTMILSDAEEPPSPEQHFKMMHLSKPPPPSSRGQPLAFKNISPPLQPQRALSFSHLEKEDVAYDVTITPRVPKRLLSLLDSVGIQAVFSQPVTEDAKVSFPTMPKRVESLTDYNDISAALASSPYPPGRGWSSLPSLSSSPSGFFNSGSTPPRLPCRKGSIMMDTAYK